MVDSIEKASLIFGGAQQRKQGAAHSANVTTITGVATSDSADGAVHVDLGGMTISDEDEQAVELPTTCDVRKGDTVQIQVSGADGTAKNLLVTGVIGGGDEQKKEIEMAKGSAAAAEAAVDNLKTLVRETDQGIEVGKVDENGAYVGAHVLIDADGFDIVAQDGSNLGTFSTDGLSTNIRASMITGSTIISKNTNGSESKIENARIVNKSTTLALSAADGHNLKGSAEFNNACYEVFGDPDETEADYPATYNPNQLPSGADDDLVTYIGSSVETGCGSIKIYNRKTLGGKKLGTLGATWLDSDITKKPVCGALKLYSAETGKRIHILGCTNNGNPGYFMNDKNGINKAAIYTIEDDSGHDNGTIHLNRADGSHLLYIGASNAGDMGLIWGYHKNGTVYMITPIVQSGTVTATVAAKSGFATNVDLGQPLPDINYHVSLTLLNTFPYWTDVRLAVESRTKTSFKLKIYNVGSQNLSNIKIGYATISI